MIRGGYILQPRLFDGSDASRFPPVTRELWLYLLRNVSHKSNEKYKRGQGFFNLQDIRESLAWYVGYRKMTYTKSQLTKSLRRLREGNMVATTKATRGFYATICNYEYYQDPKNYEGTNEDHAKDIRRTRSGSTKNKNDKNGNKEKEYVEKPASQPQSCPHEKIIALYHETLPELNIVQVWNNTRRSYLRARWREDTKRQSLEWWKGYFELVRESPFLMGEVKDFKADLEWIIRPKNFANVLEGKYNNEKTKRKINDISPEKLDAIKAHQERIANGTFSKTNG